VRVGKKDLQQHLKPFTEVPPYRIDSSFYTDWSDAREFSIGDIGVGECAGEVVSLTDFGIAKAEGLHFEAQVLLDERKDDEGIKKAADMALNAMLTAAQALLKVQNMGISNHPDLVIAEFRKYFYDTELFFDPFVKGKFAGYLFSAYKHRHQPINREKALQLMEETRLFIEAAHECNSRLLALGLTNPFGFQRWFQSQKLQPVTA
jgi:sulfite reductase (ferredoxin)